MKQNKVSGGAKCKKVRVEHHTMVTRGLLQKFHLASVANAKSAVTNLPRTVETISGEVGGKDEFKIMFMAALEMIPKSVHTKSRGAIEKLIKLDHVAGPQKVIKVTSRRPVRKRPCETPMQKSFSTKSVRNCKKARTETRNKIQQTELLPQCIPTPPVPISGITDIMIEVVDLASSDEEEPSPKNMPKTELLPQCIPTPPAPFGGITDIMIEVVDLASSDEEESSPENMFRLQWMCT